MLLTVISWSIPLAIFLSFSQAQSGLIFAHDSTTFTDLGRRTLLPLGEVGVVGTISIV